MMKAPIRYCLISLILMWPKLARTIEDNDQSKIIAGSEMTANLPYYAQILFIEPGRPDWSFQCGATFYSQRVLLTAAHCVSSTRPNRTYLIRYGSHRRSEWTHQMRVEEVRIHPRYRPGRGSYDIAVVILRGRVAFDGSAQRIQIPHTPHQDDEIVTIYGFGRIAVFPPAGPPSPLSPVLKNADLSVLNATICLNYLRANFPPRYSTEIPLGSYICLQNTVNSTCSGDSGGPSFRSNTPFQYGLVSFGEPGCRPNSEGLFIEVHTNIRYPEHLSFLKSFDHYI